MNEKIIDLENIDLVVLFGPNNRKLHKIGEYFPDLKLVARGNTLKILGQNNQITSFEKKFESFEEIYLELKANPSFFTVNNTSSSSSRVIDVT